jgi:cytochrome c oxidase subunit 2
VRAEVERARARLLRPFAALALTAVVLLLAGCGGDQSTLNPKSEQSRHIANLWWGMFVAAAIVFLGALVMLIIGWLRRRPGLPFLGEREAVSNGLVVAFGAVIPVIALVALFLIANIGVIDTTAAPKAGSTQMTIHVIGHQWFWEVRYPGTKAVTANEIHIPTGTRVNVVATTEDVIHSFWVPELNRKIDMIPGRTNRVLLYSAKPGVFRGQCAEFCGLQHAHMAFAVFADPPDRFRAWLANEAQPRRAPTTAVERLGERAFLSNQCASCHTISGTRAQGAVGPNLTHFGSRTTLAGYMLENNPDELARWIENPQHIKPGNKMPALGLTKAQIGEIVPYLESLK